jgi:hypothetical protein
MCLAGPTYAVLLVGVITMGTGPDPAEPAAAEAARIAVAGAQIRVGCLLGVLAAMAFGAFGVATALLARSRGRGVLAALMAGAALVTTAGWSVSFTAMAAASVSAEVGLSVDVFTALGGYLHSMTLIAGFAPAGVTVLLACACGLFGRFTAAFGLVVGIGSLLATGALLSSMLDRGPLGPAVAIAFIGLPVWLTAAGLGARPRRQPVATAV